MMQLGAACNWTLYFLRPTINYHLQDKLDLPFPSVHHTLPPYLISSEGLWFACLG